MSLSLLVCYAVAAGFMGGLDCEIKMFDFASVSGILPLGKHAAPIRAVEYLSGTSHDMLVTGSWDQTGTYSTLLKLSIIVE
jgi:hypothetical protein